jgi:hypothetical protein
MTRSLGQPNGLRWAAAWEERAMQIARAIGTSLARLVRLVLLAGTVGWSTWILVTAAVSHHLQSALIILAIGGIALALMWFAFPLHLWTFLVLYAGGLMADAIGIVIFLNAQLYIPALAGFFLAVVPAIPAPVIRRVLSLRGLDPAQRRQSNRAARPSNIYVRQWLMWEMRHMPFEERLAPDWRNWRRLPL